LNLTRQPKGIVQESRFQGLGISAQLVDADGKVLWSARFDEALSDLFTL
jgi:TolB-like protein